ncbi:U4/U6-U5 snRNP complex subunit lsm3 [Paramecium bursaria]
METLEQPLDLLRLSLGQNVYIKLRGNRELTGQLISYDIHLNMLISNAQETITLQDNVQKRNLVVLYLRGDSVILISPINKGITNEN